MNVRIKEFMDYKGISSSELADNIGVQRSNVTHVLQGRNKPGFLFISKLLETYPEIDAKWLITGQGNMLSGAESPKQPDLFDQPKPTAINLPPEKPEEIAPAKENEAEVINRKESEPARVKAFISSNDKEIERIVVFYTDQTFKQYLPS